MFLIEHKIFEKLIIKPKADSKNTYKTTIRQERRVR